MSSVNINDFIKQISKSTSEKSTYEICLDLQHHLIENYIHNNMSNKHYKCVEKLFDSNVIAKMHQQKYGDQSNRLRIAILCYKIPKVGKWDPFSVKTGMPGSEEAAIYISKVLSQRHEVVVFAEPPSKSPWSLYLSNPRWVDCDIFDSYKTKAGIGNKYFDMVICWRNNFFNKGKECGKKVYFWGHDSPSWDFRDLSNLDGMFYLSKYHKSQYKNIMPKIVEKPYVISGNGVVLEQFTSPKSFTNPYKCTRAFLADDPRRVARLGGPHVNIQVLADAMRFILNGVV